MRKCSRHFKKQKQTDNWRQLNVYLHYSVNQWKPINVPVMCSINVRCWLSDVSCSSCRIIWYESKETSSINQQILVNCFVFAGTLQNYIFSGLGSHMSGHQIYLCKFKALLLQDATNQTIHKCRWCPDLQNLQKCNPNTNIQNQIDWTYTKKLELL